MLQRLEEKAQRSRKKEELKLLLQRMQDFLKERAREAEAEVEEAVDVEATSGSTTRMRRASQLLRKRANKNTILQEDTVAEVAIEEENAVLSAVDTEVVNSVVENAEDTEVVNSEVENAEDTEVVNSVVENVELVSTEAAETEAKEVMADHTQSTNLEGAETLETQISRHQQTMHQSLLSLLRPQQLSEHNMLTKVIDYKLGLTEHSRKTYISLITPATT